MESVINNIFFVIFRIKTSNIWWEHVTYFITKSFSDLQTSKTTRRLLSQTINRTTVVTTNNLLNSCLNDAQFEGDAV